MEEKIVLAVKEIAYSIKSGRQVKVDMSALINATSQLKLSSFDYWERLIRSEFSLAMRGQTPSKWEFFLKQNEILSWLDLTSWDGHKREKTLRTLSGAAPNAFFFSLAVRRLNDWVPQVREAAREKLPGISKATNPEHVVEALCIALSNWHSWGRIEAADRDVLLEIVSQEQVAESFRHKIISSAAGPMASLFSQLGRTAILDGKIEDIASYSLQPALRARAYRSLFEGRITWLEGRKWVWTDVRYCVGKFKPVVSERKIDVKPVNLDLIKQSSKDHSSIVRRVSADFLIREMDSLGDIAWELAEIFSEDKSEAVAERGRFALKKLENKGFTSVV